MQPIGIEALKVECYRIIQEAAPNWKKTFAPAAATEMAAAWARTLSGYTGEQIKEAVQNYARKGRNFPAASDIYKILSPSTEAGRDPDHRGNWYSESRGVLETIRPLKLAHGRTWEDDKLEWARYCCQFAQKLTDAEIIEVNRARESAGLLPLRRVVFTADGRYRVVGDWQDYARQQAAEAFGVPTERDLADLKNNGVVGGELPAHHVRHYGGEGVA